MTESCTILYFHCQISWKYLPTNLLSMYSKCSLEKPNWKKSKLRLNWKLLRKILPYSLTISLITYLMPQKSWSTLWIWLTKRTIQALFWYDDSSFYIGSTWWIYKYEIWKGSFELRFEMLNKRYVINVCKYVRKSCQYTAKVNFLQKSVSKVPKGNLIRINHTRFYTRR